MNYKAPKRSLNKKNLIKLLIITAVALVLLSLSTVLIIRKTYYDNLRPVNTSQDKQLVSIPLGSSVKEIGENLEKQGVIRAGWAFEWYVRNNNLRDKLQAGTYYFKLNQSTQEIADILTQGEVATDLLTIFPGQSIAQIRASLIKSGFEEQAVDEALDPSKYANHPALVDKPKGADLEGYLYPDSYERIAETTPETIITQSLNEMAEALTPEVRAGLAAQGLSVYQGITLASIVENEVGKPDDRAKAAQVFLKRLKIGMMLQSNTTDEFPAEYNTYSIAGLPPGPISNVTKSSLQAVVNPAQTDYLYFVSGRDCVTRFSQTIEQHDALKAQHGVAGPEDECRG